MCWRGDKLSAVTRRLSYVRWFCDLVRRNASSK